MSQKKSALRRYNYPVFIFLMIFSLAMIFPFVWMILSAFKTNVNLFSAFKQEINFTGKRCFPRHKAKAFFSVSKHGKIFTVHVNFRTC